MVDSNQSAPPSALSAETTGREGERQAARNAQLEEELARTQDQRKRALADLENYRRRFDRELDRLREQDREAILRDLLPVVDNLERALAAGESGNLRAGIEAVYRQLLAVLQRNGVQPIDDVGQPFDPAWQEVVATAQADAADGIVVEVVERGYRLGDRLLRPARVVVSRH
ncbi:MAG TPA: nucleotide exchange factor GrpE [Chthonomonadaceae bacterium]|nr:nucleotide exchange factor GrpE [Chthonomonadaceae bacterium]